ncbi:MAG: hypothetical protein WA030_01245 [Candidatus Microsaccharimonas sp.]
MTTSTNQGSPYGGLMTLGISQFNTSDFPQAIKTFNLAYETTKDSQEKANALHQLGLVYTKTGQLKKAMRTLDQADVHALILDNEAHHADLLRDRAWVYLMRYQRNPLARWVGNAHLEDANELLLESWEILSRLEQFEKAAVSQSYLGRIELLRGDYRTATLIFDQMDDEITSEDSPDLTYLLNLRMWRLRATTDKAERRLLLEDILPLIKKTGQTSRSLEIKVIMFGGERLYRVLQWIPAPIERLIRKILGK